MELIPKTLRSNYIIHNETMKYATFDDEEFEKNITNENITEEIVIENIKELESATDIFINKFSNIILSNKLGINEYLKKYDMKTLEFIIVSKAFKLMLKELILKLNKENNNINNIEENNFDTLISEYKNSQYKDLFNSQFPENSESYAELKQRIETILNYKEKIKNSTAKIGLIHLNLMVKYIKIYTNKIINEINIISDFEKIKSNSEEDHLLTALVLIKRVFTYPFSLLNSFLLSSEDICNIPEKSKEWDDIKKITFRVNSKEDEKNRQLLKDGNES